MRSRSYQTRAEMLLAVSARRDDLARSVRIKKQARGSEVLSNALPDVEAPKPASRVPCASRGCAFPALVGNYCRAHHPDNPRNKREDFSILKSGLASEMVKYEAVGYPGRGRKRREEGAA